MPRSRSVRVLLLLNLALAAVLVDRTPLLQASAAWQQGPHLATPRTEHTATLLGNGDVLVVGGQLGGGTALATTERFVAATGRWKSVGGLQQARASHSATPLLDGRVLVAGGRASWGGSGQGKVLASV